MWKSEKTDSGPVPPRRAIRQAWSGGAQFRVADSERDSAPKLLKVNFNDDVGIMGGVGFNIRKFFFDFRLSGYARSHVWNTFVSDGVSQRVRVPRNLVYGGSVGFFF